MQEVIERLEEKSDICIVDAVKDLKSKKENYQIISVIKGDDTSYTVACASIVAKVYRDSLMEKYENPMEHACDIEEGQVFITNGWCKPVGMCDSAWESMSPFVMTLAYGGKDIYNGWMKNEKSAMISCNDGFRPVSFLIEALEEEAD